MSSWAAGAPPAAYGAPPANYGTPPPPPGYGAPPPGAPAGYGAPPANYGAPPTGAPPQGYGAPSPAGYGAPLVNYGAPPPPPIYEQNLAQVRASLSPNARTDSSLFLNHDEEILQVVNCDGNNPRAAAQGIFNIVFIFNLVKTCCCWLCVDWNRATEHVTNVLVLTNQRLIKFKESKGSLNGDFPKR
jgi:hypothetical protein